MGKGGGGKGEGGGMRDGEVSLCSLVPSLSHYNNRLPNISTRGYYFCMFSVGDV